MSDPTAGPRSTADAPPIRELPVWLALGFLGTLVLIVFFDVLFVHRQLVLSSGTMDLNCFFIHWRHFGFEELKAGRLALWNPHYFSGAPFFGGFQAGLLYPLNFLYLLLPLDAAINWTIALHVFLAGAFTFFWARNRGLHSWACMLAAVMFMFSGPHFLQIYAGHLPNLCTLVWAPLLFLAIDQLFDRPSLGPCLLGGFATAMAVFAGHPQYVFFMAVAAWVYSLLNAIGVKELGKVTGGLALICLFGVGLSAVQLFTGLDEARESVRSIGVSYAFASSYSFPPENLLTLLTPWFFGDMNNVPYWGRWSLTDISLFVSVSGLMLALNGAVRGGPARRRFAVSMVLITLVLALGSNTPLFAVLYRYVPGFDKFRGFAKFAWLSALFLSMLAGIGFDILLKEPRPAYRLIAVCAALVVVLITMAFWLPHLSWWPEVLKAVRATGETGLPNPFIENPAVIAQTNSQSAHALLMAAAALAAFAFLLVWSRSARPAACAGILILATLELCGFAGHSLATFRIGPPYQKEIANFLKQHPGDYRVFGFNPNAALTAGTEDIWGDDPCGLLRYMRFLAFAKKMTLEEMTADTRASPSVSTAWGLVRCRFVFSEGPQPLLEVPDVMPHLLLINRCRIMTNEVDILSTLTNANFLRRQEVILETRPDPWPRAPTKPGTVRLLDFSNDTLTIEAAVKEPAILLITDAYSKGWRARPLPGSSQSQYQILPADYCLRAIPLAAGRHRIQLEYSPLGFRIGKWVSLASVAVFAACVTWGRRPSPKVSANIGHTLRNYPQAD